MAETTEKPNLRSNAPDEVHAAAVALGSRKTEKKTASSRSRILALKAEGVVGGRKQKPLSELPCTCGRGDDEIHPTNCPRGRAQRRRGVTATASAATVAQ